MASHTSHILQNAVSALCPDIEAHAQRFITPDEHNLWKELSLCLLSSQVPFDIAVAASEAIADDGVLLSDTADFEYVNERIFNILTTPFCIRGRLRRYRFHTSKARQLAQTWQAIRREQRSLRELIEWFPSGEAAREWFVKTAPGVGPKQASMFLRNIGACYNLAVLDRHVLQYMAALKIRPTHQETISTLPTYYEHERCLRLHAEMIGYRVGILDWAIWIVMRAAHQLQLDSVRT